MMVKNVARVGKAQHSFLPFLPVCFICIICIYMFYMFYMYTHLTCFVCVWCMVFDVQMRKDEVKTKAGGSLSGAKKRKGKGSQPSFPKAKLKAARVE